MSQDNILHVIEPTLTSLAGHCNSFLSSLLDCTTAATPVKLWIGRGANFCSPGDWVQVESDFTRSLRRFQAFRLYRSLLRQSGRIFISTATRTDLALLHFASRGIIEPGKVFLYVHWFRTTPRKTRFLQRIAQRQPNLVILGPTDSAVQPFRQAHFKDVRTVPYPITPRVVSTANQDFRHIFFAGIARQDKGISRIIDLVEHLARVRGNLPLLVQASADHRQQYDEKTSHDIQLLERSGYANLQLITTALPQSEYLALFQGAIALQPYNPQDFADRISGISLDALSAGSPLIVSAGTWSARIVERFGAGKILSTWSPKAVMETIQIILNDWPTYQNRAYLAGQALQKEFSAGNLLDVLTQPYFFEDAR